MRGTIASHVLLAMAVGISIASAEDCDVTYISGKKSLLYGGVSDRCVRGCQRRDDFWSNLCSFNKEYDPKLICSAEAAERTYELAKTLGNGTALQLSPCDMMPYLRGRTTWIIGDSHARSFYRAMQCFLIDFWNHIECKPSLNDEENFQLTDLPVAPGGTNCIHLLGPAGGRVCLVHVVRGTILLNNSKVAEGGVLPLLHKNFARPQDLFYINFGIWHKNLAEWQYSYGPSLEALGRFYEATKHNFPHVVFRETPAQHKREDNATQCTAPQGFVYNTTTGELVVDPDNKEPSKDFLQSWLLGIPLNKVANHILPKYDLPIIPAFNITVAMWDSHAIPPPGTAALIDCKHYCQPGAPQMWIWYLHDFLRGPHGVKPLPNVENPEYKLACKVMKSAMYLDR